MPGSCAWSAAQREKAPFVQFANRYAMIFLPASLALRRPRLPGSGDPASALAVLVVATPAR
ncbi:MAG: hypothetical protein R3D25_12805 [Geminicoccaceae bacterium]